MRNIIGSVALAATLAQPVQLIPPVDGAIVRAFEQPASRWGPGHRGIDLAAAAGTRVRAAAGGTVTFAGDVAGAGAVTIAHGGGYESTYSRLADVWVAPGEAVSPGTWLGLAGEAHPGVGGIHLGVKLRGRYVDPQGLFGPLDISAAVHLAPATWDPPSSLPAAFAGAFEHAGDHLRRCVAISGGSGRDTPNENVAVAVAGIGSRTAPEVRATMYEHGPEGLGYPEQRVYRFSYGGTRGPRFHEPYVSTDTFGDIEAAGRRLGNLLRKIARRHPRRGVDLIAHSQGGIVARAYLEHLAREWDAAAPRVEHIVTFSSPHSGAPLAGAAVALTAGGFRESAVARGLSWWARRGGPVPDPYAPAVRDLAPGSPFMTRLAAEDISFGTRALSLVIPNDPVVPPTSARWIGETTATVPWSGSPIGGHDAIVASDDAVGLARRFLRDGAPSCPGRWDGVAAVTGRVGTWVAGALPGLVRALP